jgi:hypothetical protein
MPKPPPELITPKADGVTVGPYRPVETRLPQDAMQSPKTPVTAEGLVSLQNLIVQQHTTCPQNGTTGQRLQRLIQKLAKAAQMSFAKGILQQNHIRFLVAMNNEAKVRRATKPKVLGTARVMSYQDLVEARAKRAEKDAAKEKGKGKRGRKRKYTASETDGTEANALEPQAKKTRVSEVFDSQHPWSVPVAKMY